MLDTLPYRSLLCGLFLWPNVNIADLFSSLSYLMMEACLDLTYSVASLLNALVFVFVIMIQNRGRCVSSPEDYGDLTFLYAYRVAAYFSL